MELAGGNSRDSIVETPPPHKNDDTTTSFTKTGWGYTRVKVFNVSYTWTIYNFSFLQKKTMSPSFSGASDKLQWSLRANPKYRHEDIEYVSLFLVFTPGNERKENEDSDSDDELEVKAQAKFKLSILSSKVTKTQSVRQTHEFVKNVDWGFLKFIRRDFLLDEANGFLQDDSVTIVCEVSVVGDIEQYPMAGDKVSIRDQGNFTPLTACHCGFADDLGSLYDESGFSDVVICVDGQEFEVHKGILAARSPVFKAMFEHEMTETKKGRVEITDIDHDIMKELLRYIYTGKASNLDVIAEDLLPAADKYALERLKVMCEEVLSSSLTLENASDLLILADRHSAKQLKARTIEFINGHAPSIMLTSGFKTLVKSHPNAVADAFCALASQLSTSSSEPAPKRAKVSR